jgi:hypothetical protein
MRLGERTLRVHCHETHQQSLHAVKGQSKAPVMIGQHHTMLNLLKTKRATKRHSRESSIGRPTSASDSTGVLFATGTPQGAAAGQPVQKNSSLLN